MAGANGKMHGGTFLQDGEPRKRNMWGRMWVQVWTCGLSWMATEVKEVDGLVLGECVEGEEERIEGSVLRKPPPMCRKRHSKMRCRGV